MRSLAREAALVLLFGKLFDNPPDENFRRAVYKEHKLDKPAVEFADRLQNIVLENFDNYLEIIQSLSKGYTVERIFTLDKCALLLAIAEMNGEDVPYAVTINEIVNLVRKYSTENSVGFVNGILAAYKTIKEKQDADN